MSDCKARRQQDEWQCGACGLTWAVDDADPPACLTARDRYLAWLAEVDLDLVVPAEQYHSGRGWY